MVVADVRGVGENYQTHHLLLYPYKSNLEENETLECVLSIRKDFVKVMERSIVGMEWHRYVLVLLSFPKPATTNDVSTLVVDVGLAKTINMRTYEEILK